MFVFCHTALIHYQQHTNTKQMTQDSSNKTRAATPDENLQKLYMLMYYYFISIFLLSGLILDGWLCLTVLAQAHTKHVNGFFHWWCFHQFIIASFHLDDYQEQNLQ